MSLLVLVPTRGRPESQLQEVHDTFLETKVLGDTELFFVLDPDSDISAYPSMKGILLPLVNETGNMRAALNQAAAVTCNLFGIIGFIGDDHRFRSHGWDVSITEALVNGGMAYGDDLMQGEALPTQWFLTTDIVKEFGMAPDFLNHFYIDNYWLDMANAARCRYYLPDVKIEHMHFSYGKSEMDATYQHSMMLGGADQSEYLYWRRGEGFQVDAYKLIGIIQERKK